MAQAKTATPAKKSTSTGITAYCVKTKEKNVPMLKAVINCINGKYVAIGFDKAGNKMSAIMSKATAEGHIAAKQATKGTGW